MFAQNKAKRCCAQTTVCLMLGFFVFEWWTYNCVSSPTLASKIVFNAFFILLVWSYLATALTDPGTPQSPEWLAWAEKVKSSSSDEGGACEHKQDNRRASRAWSPGTDHHCNRCAESRPERAHHCSWTGACVLRMDHFCPWVANTVGWRNHKHFILVNVYGFLCCFMIVFTMRKPTLIETFTVMAADDSFATTPFSTSLSIIAMAVFSCMFLVVCLGFAIHNIYMAVTNVTSIEENFRGDSPYKLENATDNLTQLMGEPNAWMVLPVDPAICGRKCDGTKFPLGPHARQENPAPSYGATADQSSSSAAAAESV